MHCIIGPGFCWRTDGSQDHILGEKLFTLGDKKKKETFPSIPSDDFILKQNLSSARISSLTMVYYNLFLCVMKKYTIKLQYK